MNKILTIFMSFALVMALSACGGKKTHSEAEAGSAEVVESAETSTGSEKKDNKKQSDEEKQLTPTMKKALDTENPWYARDFRMEFIYEVAGATINAEMQKSGNGLFIHAWSGNQSGDRLLLITDDEYKEYLINQSKKTATFTKSHLKQDYDYNWIFYDFIGSISGIVYKEEKEKDNKDQSIVKSENKKSVVIEDETWNGFDCEKMTRILEVKNELSDGMKALGKVAGNSKDLDNMMAKMKSGKVIHTFWLDKNSGAVLHRTYQSEGMEMLAQAKYNIPLPTVKVLTFSPDPSLAPSSLDGYKVIENQ